MDRRCQSGNSAGNAACTENIRQILDRMTDDDERFLRQLTGQLGLDYDRMISSRQFAFVNYGKISDANKRELDILLHTHSHS